MIAGLVSMSTIEENWDEVLRLAASIRAGTVPPSVILRKIAAFPRQNDLNKALREIGRIERSLFMADWLMEPALRRRSNANLNKMGCPGAPCAVDGTATRPEAGTWRWCRATIGRTACSPLDWTSP